MLLIKHTKGGEGVVDYMNKKKYGIMIGIMGIIIVLLTIVLVVLIKQKSNTVGCDAKKVAESVVPEELVGEWMLGDNVEYLTGIIELVYIVLQSVVKPGITGFFKIDLHIKCYIYLS